MTAALDGNAERRAYLFTTAWLRDETRNATAYADALAFWRGTVLRVCESTSTSVTSVARLQTLLTTPSGAVPDADMLRRLVALLCASSAALLVPTTHLAQLARVRSAEARRLAVRSSATASWLRWAVDATVRTTAAVVTAVSSPIRGNGNASSSSSSSSVSLQCDAPVDLDGEFVVVPLLARLADAVASRAAAKTGALDSLVDRVWFKPDVYALVPNEPIHLVDRALDLLCAERRAALVQLDSGAQFVRFSGAAAAALVVTDDDVNIAALKVTRAKLTAQCDKAARDADECRAAALKCARDQRALALRHVERRRRLLRVQDERCAVLEKVSMVLDAIDAAHDAAVTHEAMRLGAVSLRRANAQTTIDEVDETMLDIEEVLDEQQRVLDAMALEGDAADTAELEQELEALEDKASSGAATAADVPAAAPSPQVDELAAQLARLAVVSGSPTPTPLKPTALFSN
jgi:hypothetical protein